LNGVDVMLMESRQTRLRPRQKSPLWVFTINPLIFDKELGPMLFRTGVLPSEFINEIVEGSPQVVDDFPDNYSSVQGKVGQEFASKARTELIARRESQQLINSMSCRVLIGDE